MAESNKYQGRAIKRVEDLRLIQGSGRYVDDIKLVDTLHVAFLRSPYAHARITSIEVQAAKSAPGVVVIFTGRDIEGDVGFIPCAAALEGLQVPDYPVLASRKVNFVGQAIAAVVATDVYKARDAVDLIEVEFDPLDVVIDPELASRPDSPVIHEELGSNIAFVYKVGLGDVDAAFARADRIIAQGMVHQRLAPSAIESRGVLAQYLPGEQQLTIWTSTQVPHLLRTKLAQLLSLPEDKVRVIAPEVGGSFGSKLNVYPEEALLGFITQRLQRPVKWIETRRENLAATTHGRAQVGRAEIAVTGDGTIIGLRYRVIADLGGYLQLLTPAVPTATGLMLSGAYRIPAISMTCTGVFTNKVATDAYRGAGRPEATYVVERIVDIVAQELHLDPVQVRRRNFVKPEEFPFATATGVVYDGGNYQAALDKALDIVQYQKLRQEQQAARAQGRLLGIGLSSYVEISGVGPSSAMPIGGWESATVRLEPTGKVTILTGVSPHGQGEETAFAQIAADALGVDLDDITVIHGDTSVVPQGIGTFGSRGIAVGGAALVMALEKIKQKATALAAHLLRVDESRLVFSEGRFSVDNHSMTLQDVALAAHLSKDMPLGRESGLSATCVFEPGNFTFPFGTHVCVVEVDRETGDVKVRRYVAVDDCGRVINPLLVDGQIHGGIAQGLGQALFEEVVYDDQGQLLTGTFADYALPRAHHLPDYEVDRTETPTDINPLGAKGVGESGAIGATPALVNAVVDALAPFGVRHIDMPLRPEKLWRLMQRS